MKNKQRFLSILFIGFALQLSAQEVYENHRSEIYNYIGRMAQKGLLDFEDHIRPLSKTYLAACLDTIAIKSNKLTVTEKKELAFYQQEFNAVTEKNISPTPTFFNKDKVGRWRSFYTANKNTKLFIDPVIRGAVTMGDNVNYQTRSTGLHFWGTAGKRVGFQFFFSDVNEIGKGFDTNRQGVPGTGIIRKDTSVIKSQNFSEFRGSINYAFKNGSISFGQDHLLYGYGENGRIVLSDKAPNFPFLRFDYSPFSWLRFNNTHAWLNSKIVDSARTYGTDNSVFGGERQVFIPKFLSTHSILIKAMKGLDVSIGESVVYSDRLDVGYLIPVMFYKVYDNIANNSHIQAGSNAQIFFNVSSRNQLKNTHLYTSVFIDEIRMSTVFVRAKSRNQLGYTVGGSITDIGIPYLTFNAEYTRINPFVYNNIIPAQTYTSHGYFMGDWMGSNADRLLVSLKYTPLPRLKCMVRYQAIRKGDDGTIVDQYLQQPQPALFEGDFKARNEIFLNAHYELLNGLTFNGWYSNWNTTGSSWSLGVSYGL
jgi:hypothetical protein